MNRREIISITEKAHPKEVCLGKNINGRFELYPNVSKERDCIYISGPSGVGKTTFAIKYLIKYKSIWPDREIYMFSNKPMNKVFDLNNKEIPVPRHKHIIPTKEYFEDKTLKDFSHSLVLFDDVENISSDKEIQTHILNLLEEMLNVGRSYKITILIISHVLMNYRFTKNIISECSKIVMFPRSGVKSQYRNFMKRYLNFDYKFSDGILNTKSRWLVLNKNCPLMVLTKNELKILED